jgi:Protein of unknown function (DUF1761)
MTLNILAIAVTAVIHFGIGAIWYITLEKHWLKALGKTKEAAENPKNWSKVEPYIVTLVASFAITTVTAYILSLTPIKTLSSGAMFGFILWLGYIITDIVTHYSYGDRKKSLILIDSGYFLVSFVVITAILAVWK